MKIIHAAFVLFLLLMVGRAGAFTIDFAPVCKLVASSDTTLRVQIASAEDICSARSWRCAGTLYLAQQRETDSPGPIRIISSEQLSVGSSYTLFAEEVRESDQVFLYNMHYSSFPVPANVDYYVKMGSAFLFDGQRYFRRLPSSCVGDGPDCRSLTSDLPSGSTSFASAEVLYPDFEKEVASCPR